MCIHTYMHTLPNSSPPVATYSFSFALTPTPIIFGIRRTLHPSASVSILQHTYSFALTSAYVSIRQHPQDLPPCISESLPTPVTPAAPPTSPPPAPASRTELRGVSG